MKIDRVSKCIPSAALVVCLGIGIMSNSAFADSKGANGPSFDDPHGLCDAIVYLPTHGWHHDFMGWGCISDLKEYGPRNSSTSLPSTYQYMVSGDVYEMAKEVELRYNVNNTGYRSKSLKMMATYAKTLAGNTAFHLSNSMLAKIRKGSPFIITSGKARIAFNIKKTRIDSYVLRISRQ
ncbi:hypothetical protein [Salinisphaera sp. LB1]|uniref:hypothetical protein n=1 Tax=Salinisphaera sp. LB1 TaxID=2183911 RepID=UPI0011AB44A7|nr:hypothetical protein [Salinisphaera sp. LB1]